MDVFRTAVEAAWDWAEERQVGIRLRRTDEWLVRLTFGDTYGRFVEDVPLPGGMVGATTLADDEVPAMVERFRRRLDKACADARAARGKAVKGRLA